jgi:hypothetical protein
MLIGKEKAHLTAKTPNGISPQSMDTRAFQEPPPLL